MIKELCPVSLVTFSATQAWLTFCGAIPKPIPAHLPQAILGLGGRDNGPTAGVIPALELLSDKKPEPGRQNRGPIPRRPGRPHNPHPTRPGPRRALEAQQPSGKQRVWFRRCINQSASSLILPHHLRHHVKAAVMCLIHFYHHSPCGHNEQNWPLSIQCHCEAVEQALRFFHDQNAYHLLDEELSTRYKMDTIENLACPKASCGRRTSKFGKLGPSERILQTGRNGEFKS